MSKRTVDHLSPAVDQADAFLASLGGASGLADRPPPQASRAAPRSPSPPLPPSPSTPPQGEGPPYMPPDGIILSAGEEDKEEKGDAVDYAPVKKKANTSKHVTFSEDKLEEGLCIVKEWSFFNNAVAKALVKVALHTPEWFTRVEKWQDKLYTALTNTVWIQDTTKRYAIFSMRKASGVVAFVDSATGGAACQGYMDGPYCNAPLGDEVDFENEMHRLMRSLDFYTIPFPEGDYRVRKFHEEYTDGTGAEPLFTPGPGDDYVPEKFWIDAAHLWCHKPL